MQTSHKPHNQAYHGALQIVGTLVPAAIPICLPASQHHGGETNIDGSRTRDHCVERTPTRM